MNDYSIGWSQSIMRTPWSEVQGAVRHFAADLLLECLGEPWKVESEMAAEPSK